MVYLQVDYRSLEEMIGGLAFLVKTFLGERIVIANLTHRDPEQVSLLTFKQSTNYCSY
jgi:hypothetical protein